MRARVLPLTLAPDYPEVARAAIREMHRQVGDLVLDERGLARRGLLVRHLVMPGLLDESREIFAWLARELGPATYLNLMGQYYPAGKVTDQPEKYADIARRPAAGELQTAFELAAGAGIRRFDERRSLGR